MEGLETLARSGGFRLHVFKSPEGMFQASLSGPRENSWTCEMDASPQAAIKRVVNIRLQRLALSGPVDAAEAVASPTDAVEAVASPGDAVDDLFS